MIIEYSTESVLSNSCAHHFSLDSSTAWHSLLASEYVNNPLPSVLVNCMSSCCCCCVLVGEQGSVVVVFLVLSGGGGVIGPIIDCIMDGLVRIPLCLESVHIFIEPRSAAGVVVSLNVSLVFPEHATGTLAPFCSPSPPLSEGLLVAGERDDEEEEVKCVDALPDDEPPPPPPQL